MTALTFPPGPAVMQAAVEEAWCTLLDASRISLIAGRSVVWDRIASRVSVFLITPAAYRPEHFMQVRARSL